MLLGVFLRPRRKDAYGDLAIFILNMKTKAQKNKNKNKQNKKQR